MRGWEILVENEITDFESDVEDLLIAAKANGMTELSVDSLVDQLNFMGYAVTADSLVASLEENEHEFIKTITLNTIILKTHSFDDQEEQDYEDEEFDAAKLASKTAMKGITNKQKKQKEQTQDMVR